MSVRGRIGPRWFRPLPVIAGLVVVVPVAQAALPQQSGLLNLSSPGGGSIRVDGVDAGDRAGDAVAGIGDFDGDGARDILVGAWKADPFGRPDAGAAYVVFGPIPPGGAQMGAAEGVLRINGATAGDYAGISVAAAGDVNGDGHTDVVVGAQNADSFDRINSGTAYVVFGGPDRGSVDLADLGTRGFRIDGAAAGDALGTSVAGVGDVNGDGLADVAISARGADNNNRVNSGSVYVVFGSRTVSNLDMAAPPPGATARLDGAAVGDQFGTRVVAAGDANGDGHADLAVSAPTFDPGGAVSGRTDAGAVYVVFGAAPFAGLDVGGPQFTTRGFRVDGAVAGDQTGWSLAPMGDADGDGFADLLVGAPTAEAEGRIDSGAAFLVRGAADTQPVDLATLGARSVRVDGALSGDYLGIAVAAVGDVTGDGRGELLIGASGMDMPGLSNPGGAYLITALPAAGRLDLSRPDGAATLIRGAAAGDTTGSTVANAGDVTGDGRPDMLIGTKYADPGGRIDAGAVDVVLGYGPTRVDFGDAQRVVRVGAAITPVGPTLLQRTGAASFTVQPALPAGVHLDPVTGVISGVPAVALPSTRYTVSMSDLAGTATAPVTLEVLTSGGITDGTPRRVGVTGLRTRCIPSRVVGRPCRIRVEFRTRSRIRLRVELRRTGARRPTGALIVRTRIGLNRITLPARFGRRTVGRGAYRVRLSAVSVPIVVTPGPRTVSVTLRTGRSAR